MTTDKRERAANFDPPMTTGIGSLPHHNIDAALHFAFQMDIPFLPQIPIRNPWEFMIAQSLEGLPGLEVDVGGAVALDLDVWAGRSHALNEKLLTAFTAPDKVDAFESFEPSSATSSSWQPFLWELEEHHKTLAKVQLAGPLTCQWALRLKDGTSIDTHPEIAQQILRLIMARSIAMCRRLKAGGIKPILYIDEPGIYCFSSANPRHFTALQELKLLVQALRKEEALVGLHCCSNTDWKAVLSLGLNILSIDTHLSLEPLLSEAPAIFENFINQGGRLSLGVIPTNKPSSAASETPHDWFRSLDVAELFAHLISVFEKHFGNKPEFVGQILQSALYTPACGLALHSPTDAELVLATLKEFCEYSLVGAGQNQG